jgi:hypothetical protein
VSASTSTPVILTGIDQTVLSVIAAVAGTYQVAATLDASIPALDTVSCHVVGGTAPAIQAGPVSALTTAPIPVTDQVPVIAGATISVACSGTGITPSTVQSGAVNAILITP